MPETFTPKTWVDGPAGGTPIIAAELNRLEQGVESMDDRTAALELGIFAPVSVTYAGSVSLDASTGSLFRIVATGALTIAAISNGTDGQSVTVQVTASGADRTVTWSVGGAATVTVASGTVATWTFRYYSTGSSWAPVSSSMTRAVVVLTDGATVALDATAGLVFKLIAAGNRTILAPTNAVDGREIVIAHTASGGARTLTLTTGSAGAFAFGTDITALTATTSGLTDYIRCIYDATAARWRVLSYSKGY